ncbi:MAG TPA: site-2 protease family protein [Actinomycetes bacterium]|nr:site-2 protease family protein [Actinomycetes bacterium]
MSPSERTPGGVPLGRPFGIPVFVSWSWFVAAAVITWIFVPIVESRLPTLTGGFSVLVAATFAVLLGLSVLAHELAHSVAALRYHLPVHRITLHLLGGVSEMGTESRRPGQDIVIVVVGPVTSLALSGVGFALIQILPEGSVIHLVAFQIAFANLIVGVFNLIPGLPLDGGRILRDVVWAATGREHTGTTVAAWTGRALAVTLVVLAVVPFLLVGDSIWLIWGMLLATFVWVESGRALVQARVRRGLGSVTAGSLTRRAIPVASDLPVSEALRLGAAAQAGALVAVDADGRPVRLVDEAAVGAIPEERRPWVTVTQVSRTLEPGRTVSAELSGDELLRWMDDHPASEYLVVQPDGGIFGVLSRGDVQRAVDALAGRQRSPARG